MGWDTLQWPCKEDLIHTKSNFALFIASSTSSLERKVRLSLQGRPNGGLKKFGVRLYNSRIQAWNLVIFMVFKGHKWPSRSYRPWLPEPKIVLPETQVSVPWPAHTHLIETHPAASTPVFKDLPCVLSQDIAGSFQNLSEFSPLFFLWLW